MKKLIFTKMLVGVLLVTIGLFPTIDLTGQGSLECRGFVNSSAGVNCDFMITAQELLSTTVTGPGYLITIADSSSLDTLLLGPEVIGQTFDFNVTDTSGVTCWGRILFEDATVPEPECGSDTIECDAGISPLTIGLPIPEIINDSIDIGSSSYYTGGNCFVIYDWDACGYVELCFEDEVVNLTCDPYFCTKIYRTWTVRDPNILPTKPNTASCIDTICILLPSSFTAPEDFLKPYDEISCSDLNDNGYLDRYEDLYPNYPYGNGVLDRDEELLKGVTHENTPNVLAGETKAWIPMPYVTGSPGGLECDDCVLSDWKDHIIEEPCSRFVERTWKIRGWCSNQDLDTNFVQRIKIVDDEAPIVTYCPTEYTLLVSGHACTTTQPLRQPQAYDDCDDHFYTKGVNYAAVSDKGVVFKSGGQFYLDIDLSSYAVGNSHSTVVTVTWTMDDGCENDTTCYSYVTVEDNIPPTAACVDNKNISLTSDGFGKLFAESFDAGSHDNCGQIWFKVIRYDDEHVDNVKHGSSTPGPSPDAYSCDGANGDDLDARDRDGVQLGYEVYYDDYVKFCCEDIGTEVKVFLRVYDWLPEIWRNGPVPRSAHYESGPLAGHFNDCWTTVTVEDKLGILTCPPDLYITCLDHIPDSDATSETACGNKDVELINESDFRDACGIGYVRRQYRTTHPNGSYQDCYQYIHVEDTGGDFYIYDFECNDAQSENDSPRRVDGITWPCDVNYLPCELVQTYGLSAEDLVPDLFIDGFNYPVVNKDLGACPDVFVGYDDLVLIQDGDVCYKILRTWTVIDWCGEYVTQTTPGAYGGSYDRSGPGCSPYNTKPRWCYEQILKVLDHEKPVIDVIVDVECDNVYDCEYYVSISTEVTDNCTGLDDDTYWTLYYDDDLDLDPISGYGLEVSGYLPLGHHFIRFDGEDLCGNKAHGEAYVIVEDCKQPVPICNVGIGTVVMPSNGEVTIWAVEVDADTKDCDELEFGIRRSGGTGCESELAGTYAYSTVDYFCDGDTLTGEVELISTGDGSYTFVDWDFGTYDQCYQGNDYEFGTLELVHDCATGDLSITGEDSYGDTWTLQDVSAKGSELTLSWINTFNDNSEFGVTTLTRTDGDWSDVLTPESTNPFEPYIVLDCDDLAGASTGTVSVDMQVTDASGNSDFCTTFINLQDNEGVCGGGGAPIAGTISTLQGVPVSNHPVELLGSDNEVIEQTTTSASGAYAFFNTAGQYVRPFKNDDAVNGVNTVDLLTIQQHFLGIKAFTSPYQLLAADATNDKAINVLDLLEIQEVILGLRSEFSNNQSWRYVPEGSEMTMESAYTFEEPMAISQMSASDKLSIDFIAQKIGDVNGTALADGLRGSEVSSRTNLELVSEASQIEYGSEIRMPISSSNFTNVEGYQFTLSYDAAELDFVSIESGVLSIGSENVMSARSSAGIVTTNWYSVDAQTYGAEEVLFTLVLRGERLNSLTVNSSLTNAESYRGNSVGSVSLEISSRNADENFALYQNTPNPFNDRTLIGFDLPSTSETTLSIYDVSGKEIYRNVFTGTQGYNEHAVSKSNMNGASGVLYYRIETQDYSATKKMVAFE